MSHDIAIQSDTSDRSISPDLLHALVTSLTPILNLIVSSAVERAVALNFSPTMSKKDFAEANRLSASLLEKWIANGVVLLAPTPTSTVRRTRKCEKTGEEHLVVMEKHGNALINMEAWREKNRQQAIKCRYIKA